jgi:hypothetical protein
VVEVEVVVVVVKMRQLLDEEEVVEQVVNWHWVVEADEVDCSC